MKLLKFSHTALIRGTICCIGLAVTGCGPTGFKIVEFHSEGDFDGFCYVTAQEGAALTYARSVKGEQWDCNFLMVGYPVKRLIRKDFSNEELEVHIDMSHEALAPSGNFHRILICISLFMGGGNKIMPQSHSVQRRPWVCQIVLRSRFPGGGIVPAGMIAESWWTR